MRVIAGSARHLPLKTIAGNQTRPTQDKVKETLFNILQDDIEDCRFLDLFAGSGGVGIEALSRGASHCAFCDKNRACTQVIRENLVFTKLSDRGEVSCADYRSFLKKIPEGMGFDIIFIDPPYHGGLEKEIFEELRESHGLKEDTLCIVEADKHTDFSFLGDLGFEIRRIKEYKNNRHLFIVRKEDL